MDEDNYVTRRARQMLDDRFGLGADAAHKEIHSNPTAKAIYECAVAVVAALLLQVS